MVPVNHFAANERISDDDLYVLECIHGRDQAYYALVADRNDAAVMLARTALAKYGCRATRDRVMPAAA